MRDRVASFLIRLTLPFRYTGWMLEPINFITKSRKPRT
jgi:hypothetical protein